MRLDRSTIGQANAEIADLVDGFRIQIANGCQIDTEHGRREGTVVTALMSLVSGGVCPSVQPAWSRATVDDRGKFSTWQRSRKRSKSAARCGFLGEVVPRLEEGQQRETCVSAPRR